MTEGFLDVNEINVYYGESLILKDVSMSVQEGEIVSVLGRNGVGKTTLIRSIAGILIPRSGTISFDGIDITNTSKHERSRMGISLVPQERRIIPNLTVTENLEIAYAGENASWSLDEVYELFPRLAEREDQLGSQLSGGEQQMLAIARALCQDTRLLLLDEPFEGLAPQIVETVYDRLEKIKESDITVLIVGQKLKETLTLSSRSYIIDNGKVVHTSEANALLNNEDAQRQWLGV